MEQKKGKWKRILILAVSIAIILFFTLPSAKSHYDEKKRLENKQYEKIRIQVSDTIYDIQYYSEMGKNIHSSKETQIEISNYKELYLSNDEGNYVKQLTDVWMKLEKNEYMLNIGTVIIETPGVEKKYDFSKLENPNINVNSIIEQMGLEGDYVLVTSSAGVPIALYESDHYDFLLLDNLNLQMTIFDSDEYHLIYVQNGGVYKISSK